MTALSASSDHCQPDLRHKLLSAETNLLSAVLNDSFDLRSLHTSLLEIENDLRSDSSTSPDTLGLANTVASRVVILSKTFLELENSADDASQLLRSWTDSILDEVFIDVGKASSTPSLRDIQPTSAKDKVVPAKRPSHISCFHSWLVDHAHNPYPSLADKKVLAARSGVPVKSVEDWFMRARSKIGWTIISKRYFRGDRSLTLDCAYRVLVDRTGHLHYSEQIVQNFKDMEEAVSRLYGEQVEQNSPVWRLESAGFPVTVGTSSKSRKRQRQVSPSSDCESVASSSASSTGESSRKRSCNAAEERDSLSSRSSSSLSHTASFTSCSSDSAASSPGPLTPLSSPAETHSKLPTDIFNNWIDDVSSEPVLLPPDAADQPCSVLSQKRALSDSDSHHTAKRARLERPPAPTATSLVSHPATLPENSGPLSIANEFALSMPPLLDILPIAGEADASVFGSLPPLEDANPDLFSHFITQLEREVPSASTWDDSLLGGSAVEAVPFNFGGSAAQASNANTQPTSSVVDFFSLFGLEGAAGQDNSEAANNPLLEGQAKDMSEAVLLSSTDLAFLDGLGGSENGDPDTWSTCADAPGDMDSPATLIDTLSSPQEPEVEDEERTKKLRRLQELLEEAEKLKQEVYG